MPWGFGRKSSPTPSDHPSDLAGSEPEEGAPTTLPHRAESTPLPSEVRFRIEAVVQYGGLYSVIGETEQGTLRLPTVLKRLRVTSTSESGAPIPVVSAMAHHKKVLEVPTRMKVSLTMVYEFDRGTWMLPKAAPNVFGLEKGDLLVTP